jgi:cullin 1
MAILLQYNSGLVFGWDDLVNATGMTSESLVGHVGVLVKAKVLTLSGSLGAVGSTYTLNPDFRSKKIRVNLNIAVKSEQKAESEETHLAIAQDREYIIQAAIVRIMKTRKTLKHTLLMQEVISQLQSRFKPQVPDIKKMIDHLLEKEYIERCADARDSYNYVA